MSGSGDEGRVSGGEGLPEGWAWATVGEVGEIDLGRQRHPDWHNGPEMRPYLRVANVFEDRIDTADLKEMDFSGVFDRYRLEPGDVLLNEGQSPHLVGRPAIYRGEAAEVAFTNTLIRFRAGSGLLPEWALLVFRRHMHFGRFMREARITTNLAHLSAVRLKAVEFPVPPTAEQRRIADAFAARVAQLDSIERTLRHAQATLERLETLVMATASTGLLGSPGPSVPADPPPVLGVIDGALPDTAPGWTWARLDEIAAVVSGVAKDSKKQDDSGLPEVPYLRAANAQRAKLDLSHVTRLRVPDKTLDKLRLRAGDVLMTEGGDRDKLGRGWIWEDQIEDCIHQNHLFRARLQDGTTHPKLLSWYVNSAARRWFEVNGKQSVNLASISMSKVRKLPVPIPPSDPSSLQEEAVAVGERALRHMAVLSSRCREGIRHIAGLRRALLSEAFSGRLVPQNPDDEPAEVLLKRIRVEREDAEAERKAARRAARTKARQASAPAPPPHHYTATPYGEQTALSLEFSS